ncbi:MAG: peptidoglycan DD-metalloendopeptidase family protein [Mariprofundaceae bacterium]|nr:peptidoglycan DD-metalloendopeptidase family protein [Mariprofundaceae bacterium]
MFPVLSSDAADTAAKLEKVKQQRIDLQRSREELEARLGTLGAELKGVDSAVVQASSEARQASKAVRSTDVRIDTLRQRQSGLQLRIERLGEHMQREASLAYRQSGRASMWLDMMFDASVADIPHRQYLMSRLVEKQQQDRAEFTAARQALAATQAEREVQRKQLDAQRSVKQQRLDGLEKARAGKRALWKKVKHDARLKAEREAHLSRQEQALKKLLAGVGSTLLNTDNTDDWKPMRKLKGKLPWPIDGKIVAGFHSPTAAGRPSLAGVQLAPRHSGGQVKAVAAGQVRYADWFGGYGLMLIVDHGDGLMTVYAHNDALYKRPGDWVAEGDVLADPGSTGWVQKKRLYFEVRDAGRPSNPLRWCRKKG